jgi:predicted metal-dependent phosphoesterase TrpH
MKCDLHVHTRHSGKCNVPVLKRFCRESYNDPESVYQSLKQRGMDLVTITDHDSIDAAEDLRHYPDFFLSEEVTVEMPSGGEMHVGVYDINERQHIEIQKRRNDLPALIAYFHEQNLFFSANHVFSSLTGRRTVADFEAFEQLFPALETLNGCMLQRANRAAAALASRLGKVQLGGSDAHAQSTVGMAWTVVPNARNRQEFFAQLRAGATRTEGSSGNYLRLTRDVFSIGGGMMSENPWTIPVALLGGLVPLIILVNYIKEADFVRRWSHRVSLHREFVPGLVSMPGALQEIEMAEEVAA